MDPMQMWSSGMDAGPLDTQLQQGGGGGGAANMANMFMSAQGGSHLM